MPIDEAGLMAAVDAGLKEATPEPAPAPDPAPEPEPTPEPTPEGNEPEGEKPEGDEPEGEGEGEGEKPEGDEPGAPKTPEEQAAAEAEAKRLAAEPPKPPDPLNDPLPNALKRETKERIKTLINMVKENEGKAVQAEQKFTEMIGYIEQTRATPEQYGQALDYLRLVNSGDPVQMEQALVVMQNEVAALARLLGKPVPGVNMLEGQDDLMAEVNEGKLSIERANEIAANRVRQTVTRAQSERNAQVQQQQTQVEREFSEGKRALNELEKQLSTDPAYPVKRQILIETLRPVFRKIPPADWAETFRRAYAKLPAPVANPRPATTGSPAAAGANGGGNTPLRASNPAGAQMPEPKSMQEAIERGLQMAGR